MHKKRVAVVAAEKVVGHEVTELSTMASKKGVIGFTRVLGRRRHHLTTD
jgi:hypothetical protein